MPLARAPTGDLTHNLGMRPDPESIQTGELLIYGMTLHPTLPHWPGFN